jgi:hypothetical protein
VAVDPGDRRLEAVGERFGEDQGEVAHWFWGSGAVESSPDGFSTATQSSGGGTATAGQRRGRGRRRGSRTWRWHRTGTEGGWHRGGPQRRTTQRGTGVEGADERSLAAPERSSSTVAVGRISWTWRKGGSVAGGGWRRRGRRGGERS